MSANGPFVIRPQTPRSRRLLLRLAMAGVGLFALYVVYEFGRYRAGYDGVGEGVRHPNWQQQVADLQRENHDLRTQLAALDSVRAGEVREREEVASQIAELQAQIDRDRQDLAVYRGVVSPSSAGSVQVQQLRITTDGQQAFKLHLTLMQAGRPDAVITGTVQVRVQGDGATAVSAVGSAVAVSGQAAGEKPAVPAQTVTFSFRYYQALEYSVQLPAGLRPQKVEVELRPSRRGTPAVTQSFPWKVEPT